MIRKIVAGALVCLVLISAATCDGGSGSGSKATPSPTATPRITQQEAEQAVIAYLQAEANTSHGQALLDEFFGIWHQEGDYLDSDGNWVLRAGVYQAEVWNSSMLAPVFAGAESGVYVIEWWVGDNGSIVYTHNWNAKRLEDALHEE